MDEQTINDELDFSASESTTEQTEEMGETPVEETIEQSDNQAEIADDSATSTNDRVEDQADVQTDEAIKDFLATKGINVDEPGDAKELAYKLGKMYVNSERQYKAGTQEIAKLQRRLNEQSTVLQNSQQSAATSMTQQNAEKLQNELKTWMQEKGLTPEEEAKMTEWLSQSMLKDPNTGQDVPLRVHWLLNGQLTLDDVYNASGCSSVKADTLKAKMLDEVKKEAAARQNAKRPTSSSSNSTQFSDNDSSDGKSFLAGLFDES